MYTKNGSRSKKLRLTKKTLVIGLLATLLLAGGSVFAYQQFVADDKPTDTATDTPTTPGTEGVNLDPATDEEKAESEQAKENIAQQQNQIPPDSGKKKVTPTVVSADVNGVSAYVTGIFEEGGTCTATFTKGGQNFSRTSAGFQNASYTQCAPISLTRADFPSAGSWSITVKYSSAAAEGTSAATTFTVN